jgi:hypothetical protein
VKECAFFLTDIDEGCLNAGENCFDTSEVDVTDRAAVIGPVHQQFYQPIVFQDGHAGFPLAPIDQDFTLQCDLSRPLGIKTRSSAGLPTTVRGACRGSASLLGLIV